MKDPSLITRKPNWTDIVPFFIPWAIIAVPSAIAKGEDMILVGSIVLWISYVLIPTLDFMLPYDRANVAKKQVPAFENDKRFLIPLYVFWATEFYLFFASLHCVSTGAVSTSRPAKFLLYCFLQGGACALCGVVGHELFHRRQLVHKVCGTLTFAKMLYSHFYIEHRKGHHTFVATPRDPATARFDESLYAFLARTIPGGYKSAWKIEQERVGMNHASEPALQRLLRNKVVLFNLGHAAWLVIVYRVFGLDATLFHLCYSLFGIMYLEMINYVEHYGLRRKKDANGNYEAVTVKHSWNAPHRLSNYFFFKLQRHSDHHANSYKPYQLLNTYEEAPCLPHSYNACLMLCANPSLWRKIMNPYAECANKNQRLPAERKKELERLILNGLLGIALFATVLLYLAIRLHYS